MSDYEHACMRAELLGLEKPDPSEFAPKDDDPEALENLSVEGEQIERVNGGFDELNAVIGSTRKKLTRYQSLTGRLGSLIKKSPSKNSSPKHNKTDFSDKTLAEFNQESQRSVSQRSAAISEEMGKQIDTLDQLLMKAEYAEMSLKQNNKLIKKIIRK